MARGDNSSVRDISGEGGILDFMYAVKSVLSSYIVSIVLLFIAAVVITATPMSDFGIGICVNVITALSLIVCGFLVSRKARSRGLLNGAGAGLLYTVLLYVIGSLVTQDFSLGMSTVTALSLGVICGGIGGVMGINSRRRKKKR